MKRNPPNKQLVEIVAPLLAGCEIYSVKRWNPKFVTGNLFIVAYKNPAEIIHPFFCICLNTYTGARTFVERCKTINQMDKLFNRAGH